MMASKRKRGLSSDLESLARKENKKSTTLTFVHHVSETRRQEPDTPQQDNSEYDWYKW